MQNCAHRWHYSKQLSVAFLLSVLRGGFRWAPALGSGSDSGTPGVKVAFRHSDMSTKNWLSKFSKKEKIIYFVFKFVSKE